MADTLSQPTLTPGVKRTYDGTPVAMSPDHSPMQASPTAASPSHSNTDSTLTEMSIATPQHPSPALALPTSTGLPAAKKPKLTPAEKQIEAAIKEMIKQEKARLKAEAQAKKDEEKRQKAEEQDARRREREADKAEKEAKAAEKKKIQAEKKAAAEVEAAKKEAEKQKRDAEKQRKEDEKQKKERSQLKLGAFFGKPASTPATPDNISHGATSRRSSIASIDMEKPEEELEKEQTKAPIDDYIQPFFIKDHMELAPSNRFLRSSHDNRSDPSWLEQTHSCQPARSLFRPRRPIIRSTLPIKDLVALSNGSSIAPIDLTSETTDVELAIKRAPFKMLQFREDVRPPYLGTYTRPVSPKTSRKLSRKPTYRGLPDTDYDYDSEAEWQEPEADDEDLDNEENESEEEDGPDDMDDFLDDEADIGKRAIASVDAEPVSTGLCWEGDTDLVVGNVNLAAYRLQVMHDDQTHPIDPYSTDHWAGPTKTEKKVAESTAAATMQPPRLPLANVSVNTSPMKSFLLKDGKPIELLAAANSKAQPTKSDKPIQFIPDEFLDAFKEAVQGSDLNQNGLVEILKKKFPSCKKPAIKDTLKAVARREGAKEADKRWVLI